MKESGFRDGKHWMISDRAVKQLLNCVKLLADIKPSAAEDLHGLINYVKKCPNIQYTGFDKLKTKKKENGFSLDNILKEAGITYPKDKD
tara:strand:+ start:687 stop:953 length:267 start_codon:yes stop_codon:yes gene_type:complete